MINIQKKNMQQHITLNTNLMQSSHCKYNKEIISFQHIHLHHNLYRYNDQVTTKCLKKLFRIHNEIDKYEMAIR